MERWRALAWKKPDEAGANELGLAICMESSPSECSKALIGCAELGARSIWAESSRGGMNRDGWGWESKGFENEKPSSRGGRAFME